MDESGGMCDLVAVCFAVCVCVRGSDRDNQMRGRLLYICRQEKNKTHPPYNLDNRWYLLFFILLFRLCSAFLLLHCLASRFMTGRRSTQEASLSEVRVHACKREQGFHLLKRIMTQVSSVVNCYLTFSHPPLTNYIRVLNF